MGFWGGGEIGCFWLLWLLWLFWLFGCLDVVVLVLVRGFFWGFERGWIKLGFKKGAFCLVFAQCHFSLVLLGRKLRSIPSPLNCWEKFLPASWG